MSVLQQAASVSSSCVCVQVIFCLCSLPVSSISVTRRGDSLNAVVIMQAKAKAKSEAVPHTLPVVSISYCSSSKRWKRREGKGGQHEGEPLVTYFIQV